jgi:Pectate lyase superfamily protein
VRDHLSAIDVALGQFGAANSFIGLSDTPATYAGHATRFVKVRPDESGLEFAPAPGGSGGLTGWIDVKADFGASGNGSTNDTQTIQTALNSGASVVYLPPGTYRVTSQLTVTPGTKLVGAGAGKTIIDGSGASIGDGSAVFRCIGTEIVLPALSSSISLGDGAITYASSVASNLSHGDWVKIVDTTPGSMDGADPDGFYCMVQAAEGSLSRFAHPAHPSVSPYQRRERQDRCARACDRRCDRSCPWLQCWCEWRTRIRERH